MCRVSLREPMLRFGMATRIKTRIALLLILAGLSLGAVAQVPVPTTVSQVVSGVQHSCALTTEGTVWCWGRNTEGQLGNGSLDSPDSFHGSVPRPVIDETGMPLSDIDDIAAGGHSTCARLSGGVVKCWGQNGKIDTGPFDCRANSMCGECRAGRCVESAAIGLANRRSGCGDDDCITHWALLEEN